jgi:hypothetical protein
MPRPSQIRAAREAANRPPPQIKRYRIIDPNATDFVYKLPQEPKGRTHYLPSDDPRRTDGIEMTEAEAAYYLDIGALAEWDFEPKSARGKLARALAEGENPANQESKGHKSK